MFDENLYNIEFHSNRNVQSRYAAQKILKLLLGKCDLKSMVDIGCGVGTWLEIFKNIRKFIGDTWGGVLGVDGLWLDTIMCIPRNCFIASDLNNKIPVNEKFDLCTCLEVAEHLLPERSISLVNELCGFSDIVLFSAAFCLQGGTGHINEHTLRYWKKLFKSRGYTCIDCIRPYIFFDKNIPFWYKQNIVVFSNNPLYIAQLRRMENSFISCLINIKKAVLYSYHKLKSIVKK